MSETIQRTMTLLEQEDFMDDSDSSLLEQENVTDGSDSSNDDGESYDSEESSFPGVGLEGENEDSISEEGEEVEDLTESENRDETVTEKSGRKRMDSTERAVWMMKALVVVVLLCSAATAGTLTYVLLAGDENDDFRASVSCSLSDDG